MPGLLVCLLPNSGPIGGYVAFAPDLPGCTGDGESAEAAISDLEKAIEEWIEEASRLGRSIPKSGAFGNHVKEQRNRINDLLRAQEELIRQQENVIKAQDEGLSKAKQDIERPKAGVLHFIGHEGAGEGAYLSWAVEIGRLPTRRDIVRRKHPETAH